MRKTQQKLIEKATRRKFPETWIQILSREDLTVDILDNLYRYLYWCLYRDIPESQAVDEIQFFLSLPCTVPQKEYLERMQAVLRSPVSREEQRFLVSLPSGGHFAVYLGLFEAKIAREDMPAFLKVYDRYKRDGWSRLRFLDLLSHSHIRDSLLADGDTSIFAYLYSSPAPVPDVDEVEQFLERHPDIFQKIAPEHAFSTDGQLADEILQLTANHFERRIREKYDFKDNVYYSEENEYKDEMLAEVGEVARKWDTTFHVELPLPKSLFIISIAKNYVNFVVKETCSFYLNKEGKVRWENPKKILSFCITPNGDFLSQRKNGKGKYPMTIKQLYRLQKYVPELFSLLREELIKENIFFADVFSDCQYGCLLPLRISDLKKYHNRRECMLSSYKKAEKLKIDFNKRNLNICYLQVKALSYVEKGKSTEILMQEKGFDFIKKPMDSSKAEVVIKKFLAYLILQRIVSCGDLSYAWCEHQGIINPISHEEMDRTAYDYVSMSVDTGKKVKLTMKTATEVINCHDAVNKDTEIEEYTGEVQVPKHSHFQRLRELLPASFEWITTRERLVEEAKMLHHCVWRYAEEISKDRSAIYSYVDTYGMLNQDKIPRRYTIEFRVEEGNYVVKQSQGAYNEPNTSMVKEYVEQFLSAQEQANSA